MIEIKNISLAPDSTHESLRKKISRLVKTEITDFKIVRKSVDARKKDNVHFVYTVQVDLGKEEDKILSRLNDKNIVKVSPPLPYSVKKRDFTHSPVVVGAGPAGLFCAYVLALSGANPIMLERGEDVDSRIKRVNAFWEKGIFSPASNVQFGEGGAGTFSDGKLTTGTHDPRNRRVLEILVKCGAPSEILYLHKPHIGTDNLVNVTRELRKRIIGLGGCVHFNRKATRVRIEDGKVSGVEFCDTDGTSGIIQTDTVVMAIGHSARDVFAWLEESGADMQAKAFSVGVRIEHLQEFINRAQYGEKFAGNKNLPVADYKLSCHLPDGRGVYTFCMCPGGRVIAAASEENGVVTNGMSVFARNSKNANSALLVGVTPDDFGNRTSDGIDFQRRLEQAAFIAGGKNYHAPAQTVGSFLSNLENKPGKVEPSYLPGVVYTDFDKLFPEYITEAMRFGLRDFDRRVPGFATPDAVMTGVETRTSSPVRIMRDESLQSNLRGLYPCGEGAGYAGGIMSAAADGMRVAEAIIEK